MDFLKKIFGVGSKGSAHVAKNRLQIVLMHDRTDISPELLDNLRAEIVKVLIKYMDIDTGKIGINLEHEEDVVALVASIPVLRIKRGGKIEAAQ